MLTLQPTCTLQSAHNFAVDFNSVEASSCVCPDVSSEASSDDICHPVLLTHQIGCYFGAELCSFDVNSDGNTDFLLVGAPLFYHPQEKREGQIHVYRLTKEVSLLWYTFNSSRGQCQ